MKLTKQCPKCQGTHIYTDASATKYGERGYLPLTGIHSLRLDIYLCSNCGYFEEYVTDKDLQDAKKLAKMKLVWRAI